MRLMLTTVHLQELNLKNTRTGYMPSLSAFMNHQQQVLANELTFDTWIPSTVWGLNLRVPIFTSFGTYNNVQKAKIEFEKTELQKERVEEQLKLGAEQAKTEYLNAIAVLESRKESMELAKRIADRTLVKYKEGLTSSLDYTQTQNQYLTAEGNYINALFSVLQAKSALDKAYGNYNKQ
jgi:outer membrane protein TolC